MIKLIVTDLNGCLLDGAGNLPESFPAAYEIMKNKNVVFAAASGRSVIGIKTTLGSRADEMALIYDNGACVYYRGQKLFTKTLPLDDYLPVLNEARARKDIVSVACGPDNAWIENTRSLTAGRLRELKKYYPSWLDLRPDSRIENIVKMAFLYFGDIEKDIYPYFRKYDGDKLRVEVTAFTWIDVFEKCVSKGTGIRVLQKRLGISPDETIVFGDYLNDLSMAENAARSFATANAHPRVKDRFTDVIGPNTEGSVAKTIIELLD